MKRRIKNRAIKFYNKFVQLVSYIENLFSTRNGRGKNFSSYRYLNPKDIFMSRSLAVAGVSTMFCRAQIAIFLTHETFFPYFSGFKVNVTVNVPGPRSMSTCKSSPKNGSRSS